MSRSTGKTYRAVLRALLAASEGKNVAFMCSNDRMVRWTHAYAIELTTVISGMTYDVYYIKFPGEGRVTFLDYKTIIRGIKYDKTIEDISYE